MCEDTSVWNHNSSVYMHSWCVCVPTRIAKARKMSNQQNTITHRDMFSISKSTSGNEKDLT